MRIMIVDDSKTSLLVLATLASQFEGCEVLPFASPQNALAQMPDLDFDIAIVDFLMPTYNGVDFVTEVWRFEKYKDKLAVIVTADTDLGTRVAALDAGAINFLIKPIDPIGFHERLKNVIALSEARKKLAEKVLLLHRERDRAETRALEEEIIHRLFVAARFMDSEAASHATRVGVYSEAIAMAYGLTRENCSAIKLASSIHNVARAAAPEASPFMKDTRRESRSDLMQKHIMMDRNVITKATSGLLWLAAEIAGSYRERWDGKGYPFRRAGKDIPLSGRIVAMAANFDSLTTSRPYKEAWSFDRAAKHIEERSGKQFDPSCVTAFLKTLPRLYEIKLSGIANPAT